MHLIQKIEFIVQPWKSWNDVIDCKLEIIGVHKLRHILERDRRFAQVFIGIHEVTWVTQTRAKPSRGWGCIGNVGILYVQCTIYLLKSPLKERHVRSRRGRGRPSSDWDGASYVWDELLMPGKGHVLWWGLLYIAPLRILGLFLLLPNLVISHNASLCVTSSKSPQVYYSSFSQKGFCSK